MSNSKPLSKKCLLLIQYHLTTNGNNGLTDNLHGYMMIKGVKIVQVTKTIHPKIDDDIWRQFKIRAVILNLTVDNLVARLIEFEVKEQAKSISLEEIK
jgi:hypothetical protein